MDIDIKDRIKRVLPCSHTIIILLIILYFALKELHAGNIDFAFDWYNASFLKDLVYIMSDEYLRNQWFNEVFPLLLILGSFIFIILLIFYFTVWRLLFNDLIFNSENQESYEGRIYWITNGNISYDFYDLISGGLHKLFKKSYKKPDRSEFKLWIHQGFFPIFNPFVPQKCMIKIKGKWDDISIEKRGLFEKIIYAPSYLESTEIPNEFILTKDGYPDIPSINRELAEKVDENIGVLIENTQTASFADPFILKYQLKKGAFVVSSRKRK